MGHFCLNAFCFEHDLEDHLFPGHSLEECRSEMAGVAARGPKVRRAARLVGLWSVYLLTAGFYVANTWCGWQGNPEQALLFRMLDTACHAGLCLLACRLLAHWVGLCCGRRGEGQSLLEHASPEDVEAPPDIPSARRGDTIERVA